MADAFDTSLDEKLSSSVGFCPRCGGNLSVRPRKEQTDDWLMWIATVKCLQCGESVRLGYKLQAHFPEQDFLDDWKNGKFGIDPFSDFAGAK